MTTSGCENASSEVWDHTFGHFKPLLSFVKELSFKNVRYESAQNLLPLCKQQPLSQSFVWTIVLAFPDINKD